MSFDGYPSGLIRSNLFVQYIYSQTIQRPLRQYEGGHNPQSLFLCHTGLRCGLVARSSFVPSEKVFSRRPPASAPCTVVSVFFLFPLPLPRSEIYCIIRNMSTSLNSFWWRRPRARPDIRTVSVPLRSYVGSRRVLSEPLIPPHCLPTCLINRRTRVRFDGAYKPVYGMPETRLKNRQTHISRWNALVTLTFVRYTGVGDRFW